MTMCFQEEKGYSLQNGLPFTKEGTRFSLQYDMFLGKNRVFVAVGYVQITTKFYFTSYFAIGIPLYIFTVFQV